MRRRCRSCEGCHGEGWMWDCCDSGSGAQVYCDRPAGSELRERDLFGKTAEPLRAAPPAPPTAQPEGSKKP